MTATARTRHSSTSEGADRCTLCSGHSTPKDRTSARVTPARHGDRLFAIPCRPSSLMQAVGPHRYRAERTMLMSKALRANALIAKKHARNSIRADQWSSTVARVAPKFSGLRPCASYAVGLAFL